MKILSLRFQNLNSLQGTWFIDFTHTEFVSNGIFAITGATGSGKTTLFDAICLALYGRTPRLDKINKSENEIMSRYTGECFAEVEFSTSSGRYRCHWYQRRARKRIDGELQNHRHELSHAETGKIITNKIKDVATQIAQLTGLNFERFTRTVLLAQGSFAAFLQAPHTERADLLEQITGSEIYSQISKLTHQRQRAEQQKLDALINESRGITPMDNAMLQQTEQEAADLNKHAQQLHQTIQTIETQLQQHQNITKLQQEIEQLTYQQNDLTTTQQTFAPNRIALQRTQTAITLESTFATLHHIRHTQMSDQSTLKHQQITLSELSTHTEEYAEQYRQAEQLVVETTNTSQRLTPEWQHIRLLDQAIESHHNNLTTEQQRTDAAEQAVHVATNAHQTALQLCDDLRSKMQESSDYLYQHAQDESLIHTLSGITTQMAHLDELQQTLLNLQNNHHHAMQHSTKCQTETEYWQTQMDMLQQQTKQATQQHQQAQDELNKQLNGKLLREYRTEHQNLLREAALLHRIANLEQQRNILISGKPCPLCGSTEHPYTTDAPPTPNETEQQAALLADFIHQIEQQQEKLIDIQTEEQNKKTQYNQATHQYETIKQQWEYAQQQVKEYADSVHQVQQQLNNKQQQLNKELQPFGLNHCTKNLHNILHNRLTQWQQQQQHLNQLAHTLKEQEKEVAHLDAVVHTCTHNLKQQQQHLIQANQILSETEQQRMQRYGTRHPDTEEADINTKLQQAEQQHQQQYHLWQQHQKEVNDTQIRIHTLQQQINQRQNSLNTKEQDFSYLLAKNGFSNEQDWQTTLNNKQHMAQWQEKAQYLDTQQNILTAMLSKRTQTLIQLQDSVPDDDKETLNTYLSETKQALEQNYIAQANTRHRLNQHQQAQALLQQKQHALSKQQQECRRWDALHDLIGSADGNKYRQFAQGLTFALVIEHANHQLRKMSDRYLLVHDAANPLELSVRDDYQVGVIRPAKNLSGGESFIISLALALGLAHMVGHNIRVDSLFLDEGFGTLDDDALDSALETLSGLRENDKLIGVISHINTIKERIPTQIRLIRGTGGRSRLEGTGVHAQ